MTLKQKMKTCSFWISLVAALLIVARLVFDKLNLNLDEALVKDLTTGVCGVLVILGILTPSSNKNAEKEDDLQSQSTENAQKIATESQNENINEPTEPAEELINVKSEAANPSLTAETMQPTKTKDACMQVLTKPVIDNNDSAQGVHQAQVMAEPVRYSQAAAQVAVMPAAPMVKHAQLEMIDQPVTQEEQVAQQASSHLAEQSVQPLQSLQPDQPVKEVEQSIWTASAEQQAHLVQSMPKVEQLFEQELAEQPMQQLAEHPISQTALLAEEQLAGQVVQQPTGQVQPQPQDIGMPQAGLNNTSATQGNTI